jgi:predicted nuclease of restriction endonuclease-like (RecB) superfamily
MKYAQLLKAIDATSQHLLGRVAAAVNQALVIRNWLIGAYIVEFEQNGEDRARYGEKLVPRLAADLQARGISGLGLSTLKSTRLLYFTYPQLGQIVSGLFQRKAKPPQMGQPAVGQMGGGAMLDCLAPAIIESISSDAAKTAKSKSSPPVRKSQTVKPLAAELVLRFSWAHLLEFIRVDDPIKRAFYENECLKGNWSKRQLQRQIGSLLFERTGLSKNKAAVLRRAQSQESSADVADLLRDPYVLEFTGLGERTEYTESDLERALLDHLQQFLLELGTGFCFEARQQRITVGTKHDYIDLVFYQRRLRCHVLIDLKTRPFTHGDAGQMNFYLNWWKKCGMERGDNPPVGIILCSDREKTEVEFATAGMDNKLFVSRYLVALPSAEQLREFIERDRERIETQTRRGR